MKKLVLIAALMTVSYNVQAIPPPPPMPEPIGHIEAKVTLVTHVTNTTDCDGYFCKQESKTCTFNARIPVINAEQYDESYYPNSLTGAAEQDCSEVVVNGNTHNSSTGMYMTLDAANKTLKLVQDVRYSQRTSASSWEDDSIDNSNRSVTQISTLSSNFKGRLTLSEGVSSPKKRTVLANTSMFVTTQIEITDLKIKK